MASAGELGNKSNWVRNHLISFAYGFGVWLIVTGTAWLLGPFGTYVVFGTWERLGYWAAVVGVAVVTGLIVRCVSMHFVPTAGIRAAIINAALQAITIGPMIFVFNHVSGVADPADIPSIWFHLLVSGNVCLVIGLIRAGVLRHLAPAGMANPVRSGDTMVDAAAATGPMIARIAPELGQEVLYAGADGHYMVIRTTQGSDRILMRFSDGVGELDAQDGIRVHRSHWVARKAIESVEQDGHRTFVVLNCGQRVPVSRTYQDELPKFMAAAP